MNRTVFLVLLFAILFGGCKPTQSTNQNESITFIVASDMGRRGESEQQQIAGLMGRAVEEHNVDFMAIAGDPIHDEGVKSIDDEEWNLKIEYVYTAPSLHAIPWYVISGNHEYNGSVPAVLAYSDVSKRWNAPARYFTFTRRIGNSAENCLFLFIDTAPLIDRYREDPERSDAGQQDIEAQLRFIESTLSLSDAKWKIVIGHHPVYAKTTKDLYERTDLQERVGKILESQGADFYICGHIHNFQHIKPTGKHVHYIVNSSASYSREVFETDEVEGMLFGNPDPGYTLFTVLANSVKFSFINHTGQTVYEQTVEKPFQGK
jgi:DNA repair exonuclease SbcCD nuclease subunit